MSSDLTLGVRLLIAGLPRSGTTWIARMLASCADTTLVMEPDNHHEYAFALRKRSLPGRYFTALAPGEPAPGFETLWQEAFRPAGDTAVEALRRRVARRLFRRAERQIRAAFTTRPRMSPMLRAAEVLAVPTRPRPARNVIVKTVYAARALEWIADRTGAQVVVVRRDLRSVVSSWVQLWGVASGTDSELEVADPQGLRRAASDMHIPAPPADPLEETTWLLAVLDRLMAEAAARHPDWTVVRYEDLLGDPTAAFRSMARDLRLSWGRSSDELLRASDHPGTRYEIRRVAAEARDVWRTRLTPDQERQVSSVLAAVGVPG